MLLPIARVNLAFISSQSKNESEGRMASSPNPAPAAAPAAPVVPTNTIIEAMLNMGKNVSDLIISPGRPAQVELSGQLVPVPVPGFTVMSPADTARFASDLIGQNKTAAEQLKNDGSADLSYAIPGKSRFRVNIFKQRGTYAVVMRVIPTKIPTFEDLHLPDALKQIPHLKNGIVLVTGPTGSGKSSTLAAIIDMINTNYAEHIITIEDPVEFMHPHKKATIHQRELHSDTPSFALALRAALRQAPKVILVGEMRDKETIEIALTAAETGHLVFSTLHTIDASKTVERIVGVFPMADQEAIRQRLSASFRYFISQRLLPKKDGSGRIAVLEILKSTMRTRDYVEKGETEGRSLLDAMRDGALDGMQYFDGEIEKLIRSGVIDMDTGLGFASNAGNLRLQISDLAGEQKKEEEEKIDDLLER
jgi:twitching motility protein PilT